MCYIAYTQEDREERTAVEDMPVYKIMSLWKNGSLRSWYMEEEYEVGKTERLGVPLKMKRADSSEETGGFIISEGYHSYNSRTTKPVIRTSNDALLQHLACYIMNNLGYEIGNGYLIRWRNPMPELKETLTLDEFRERFKFDTAGMSMCGWTCVIARCTVPEGSHYFENANGEIVSDAIRVDSYEFFTKPEEDKND
jgi:hypothetical protein